MSFDPNTINFKNPKYLKNGFIDVEIEHPTFGWIPYTCSPLDDDMSDTNKINCQLFARIQKTAVVEPYVKKEATSEYCIAKADSIRQRLLLASDWSQLPDVPQETKEIWINYRQSLRDITKQPGYPTSIVWPEVDPMGNPTNIEWPPEVL